MVTPMISVLTSRTACLDLSPLWDRLSDRQAHLPQGIGPICHPELTLLTKELLAPQSELRVITSRDRDGRIAILPCFREQDRIRFLSLRKLGCVPNLYPGRIGIIHDESAPHTADSLASALLDDANDWDMFSITTVADSRTESAILGAAGRRGLSYRILSETDIPFIVFPSTWEEYAGSLAKKVRYTIRSGEKHLRELGTLEMRSFTQPEHCDDFLHLSYMVERKSWKERAGTSLTQQPAQERFHERLAPVAAKLNLFRGYILLLNGEPLAHIYGLQNGSVFCDLKESFDNAYGRFSPGSVLKALVMQKLIREGIRCWDFVGRAEFHKLRWTDRTYRQRQYVIYAGRKGSILKWRHDLGRMMRKWHLVPAPRDQFGRPGANGKASSR
jgi:CelD/BcsL family acetyltransferase involved in cellulose biosynthesis